MSQNAKRIATEKLPKIPEYLLLNIFDGQIVITDYSKNEEALLLAEMLRGMGLEVEIKLESLCG